MINIDLCLKFERISNNTLTTSFVVNHLDLCDAKKNFTRSVIEYQVSSIMFMNAYNVYMFYW